MNEMVEKVATAIAIPALLFAGILCIAGPSEPVTAQPAVCSMPNMSVAIAEAVVDAWKLREYQSALR